MAEQEKVPDYDYWAHQKHRDYHGRQFGEPYRSTVRLADFMESLLTDERASGRGIDVCCGMGANVTYVAHRFPGITWSGLDIVDDLLVKGRAILAGMDGVVPELMRGDALNLRSSLGTNSFDIVTSMQTLLCMGDTELALDNLFDVCAPGGWIFISSLFTFSVDVRMQIYEYPDKDFDHPTGPAIYNVLCLEKFLRDCRTRGVSRIEVAGFEIDVDLPKPDHGVMGTFTVLTREGRRLQFSDPCLMPWKFVAIQKWTGGEAQQSAQR